MSPNELYFHIQLDRILAKLKSVPAHVLGPKRPSMQQQEHGD